MIPFQDLFKITVPVIFDEQYSMRDRPLHDYLTFKVNAVKTYKKYIKSIDVGYEWFDKFGNKGIRLKIIITPNYPYKYEFNAFDKIEISKQDKYLNLLHNMFTMQMYNDYVYNSVITVKCLFEIESLYRLMCQALKTYCIDDFDNIEVTFQDHTQFEYIEKKCHLIKEYY